MLWKKSRMELVSRSLRTELLLRCKGKCEKCGLVFHDEGVRPQFHHKDGNPKNNKPSNIIVVCPNCHSKLHRWKVVEEENIFGLPIKKTQTRSGKVQKSKNIKEEKK